MSRSGICIGNKKLVVNLVRLCIRAAPLAYSFNEDNQDKYVMLLEAEPFQPIRFQRIKLENNKKLLRGRFENLDDALVCAC